MPAAAVGGAASGAPAIPTQGNEVFLGSCFLTLPPRGFDGFRTGDYNYKDTGQARIMDRPLVVGLFNRRLLISWKRLVLYGINAI